MQNVLEPRELKSKLDAGEALTLVDVREPAEYAGWNIAGSVNIPLGELLAGAPLPAGKPVVTVCASGARSEVARQALARRGIDASNLAGGMAAWNSVYDRARVAHEGAEVWQLRRVGKGCLSYVVVSDGEALVIDPTMDIEEYVALAASRGAAIAHVLDTHAHADHVSGSVALAQRTGARYHAPDEVGPAVPHADVRDGTRIRVGSVEVEAIATPGHTPGSTSYRLGELLFAGDTLFVESVGRPDLGQDPRPNARVLWRTLHETLLPLGPHMRVLPGHYGDDVTLRRGRAIEATLGDVRARVKALELDEDAFTAWVARNALPKPANFETIKRLNKGSREVVDPEDLRWLEAGPNRCAVSG